MGFLKQIEVLRLQIRNGKNREKKMKNHIQSMIQTNKDSKEQMNEKHQSRINDLENKLQCLRSRIKEKIRKQCDGKLKKLRNEMAEQKREYESKISAIENKQKKQKREAGKSTNLHNAQQKRTLRELEKEGRRVMSMANGDDTLLSMTPM